MKIRCLYDKLIDPKTLQRHPKNRNRHPESQIKRLAEIIEYQGWRHTITVSNLSGFITKGHGRLDAALLKDWDNVPVEYQDYDSVEQEYADVQADNAIALWAELDLAGVNTDVAELGPDFNIDLLGIEGFTIDVSDKNGDIDEVPVPPKKPKTKRGDLYVMGNHRLLCGDATSAEDVEKLMEGQKAILMVTDPPYGVKLDQSWRDGALGSKALGKGNRNLVANDDRADWFDAWVLAPVQVAYVWHASSFTDVVMASLRLAKFQVRQQIIWNKSVMIMGRGAYHFKHEPCWYCVKEGANANWVGDRKQTTVWDAAPPNHIMGGSKEEKTEHPTQKPVALYDIPLQNHTKAGDAIYDPFGGSGTALLAAERSGRRAYLLELDPAYCDATVARWERFTGLKAKLVAKSVPNKKRPASTKR